MAQGLAFGARNGQGTPVLPVDTLLAVAEEARHQHGCTQVLAVLDAHERGLQRPLHLARGHPAMEHRCRLWPVRPEALTLADAALWTVAGNAQTAYGERLLPQARHVAALPTATALLRLAPALLAAGAAVPASEALPRYIRDKVAQTTAEREALRAQAAAGTTAP